MKHLLATCILLSIAALSSAAATPISSTKAETVTVTFTTPLGTKSDDFAYKAVITVSENALDFEGWFQVKEGVAWKNIMEGATFVLPLDIIAGKPIRHTDRKGTVTERVISEAGYEKSNDLPGYQSLEWDGWRLTLENAGAANFYDRRQWGSNRSATITLHAGERVNYGAPAPDAAPCTWKWRFEKKP